MIKLEEVARAIFEAGGLKWETADHGERTRALTRARAARLAVLRALRGPSAKMMVAGNGPSIAGETFDKIFNAMIDAAIHEAAAEADDS